MKDIAYVQCCSQHSSCIKLHFHHQLQIVKALFTHTQPPPAHYNKNRIVFSITSHSLHCQPALLHLGATKPAAFSSSLFFAAEGITVSITAFFPSFVARLHSWKVPFWSTWASAPKGQLANVTRCREAVWGVRQLRGYTLKNTCLQQYKSAI